MLENTKRRIEKIESQVVPAPPEQHVITVQFVAEGGVVVGEKTIPIMMHPPKGNQR